MIIHIGLDDAIATRHWAADDLDVMCLQVRQSSIQVRYFEGDVVGEARALGFTCVGKASGRCWIAL